MIATAWRLAYQRPITADERTGHASFAADSSPTLGRSGAGGDRQLTVLTNLCSATPDSNEFLYVD